MIRILYISSTLKRSGPTNQLFNLIKYLDRDRFEPHLITLSPETDDSRWNDFLGLEVRLHALGISRIHGFFQAKSRVIQLLDQVNPDLIHTQGLRSDVLSSQMDLAIPKVATIRNFLQFDYPMTYGKLQGNLMAWRHTASLTRLTRCVGVSAAVCANLEKHFGVNNTLAIRNGVDTDFFNWPTTDEKIAIRNRLGLPVNKKLWVSSGHLSKLKDPLSLIRCFASVFSNDSNQILVFLGGGAMEAQCAQIADNYENIRVEGRVNNVADYLKAADYFVSASQAEGLPNAVLEAMACGLPVLLSAIPPHEEIVALDPAMGFIYPLGNDQALSAGFENLPKQDYSKLQQAALKAINTQLSAKVMSYQYQTLYKELSRES